jgi:hypothetical protein
MAKRIARRSRGRPPNESDIATDQHVIDMAAALVEVYGLGPQRSRDLAWALTEGREDSTKDKPKLLRGARKKAAPGSILASFKLPLTLKAHDQRLTRRLKRGEIKPRPEAVAWLVAMLRLMDRLMLTLGKKPKP